MVIVLLIFDWDGTLADSRMHIVTALQMAISECSLEARTEQQCSEIIGLGLQEATLRLFPLMSNKEIKLFSEAYSRRFLELAKADFPFRLFENAETTLHELRDRGHTLAIATGKSRKGLNRVLSSLDMHSLFSISRTADETASKPNPTMLLEILDNTKQLVENTVMIGDTSFDLQMASSIQMRSIGVSYGVHSVDELKKHDPIKIIDSIDQLLSIPSLD